MKRRLSTVLLADMIGYSRHMRRDEDGTAAAFRTVLDGVFAPTIEENAGRIVKLTGDGILAEFDSVTRGVSAAIGMQTQLATQANPDMAFRIGVNLGDVLVDGDDILGDGVNVAARLETAAKSGGICISDPVHEQVRDRLTVQFQSGGEVDLKNMGRPMQVWHWTPGTPNLATPGTSDVRPSEAGVTKPSIAVLPFDNMSSDADQEVFADGITEEITTALSRYPWFFVIPRPSAFAYKGRAQDLRQIASELNVTYVVVGAVRRAGSRLRVTAQLVDTESGTQLWADKYDGALEDIFDMQDQVAEAVVGAISPEFMRSEARRAGRKDATRLSAWENVMRGRAHLWRMSRADMIRAVEYFEKAIAVSPEDAFGSGDLAIALCLQAYYDWSDDPPATLARMVREADRAVAANPSEPWSLTASVLSNIFARRWEAAKPSAERALQASPGFPPAIAIHGMSQVMAGDLQSGIEQIERAARISPQDGMMGFWLMPLFFGYFAQEKYTRALDVANHGLQLAPENPTFLRQRASALSWLDRTDDARQAVRDYLAVAPDHTTAHAGRVPTPNTEAVGRFVEGLRRAGLPDPA
jgi:adenylate cyclase